MFLFLLANFDKLYLYKSQVSAARTKLYEQSSLEWLITVSVSLKSIALKYFSVIYNRLCYRKSQSCHEDVEIHVICISPNAPFLRVFVRLAAFFRTSAVIQISMEI